MRYAFYNKETCHFAKVTLTERKHSCDVTILDDHTTISEATHFRILSHKKKAFERELKRYRETHPYTNSDYDDQWCIIEIEYKLGNEV